MKGSDLTMTEETAALCDMLRRAAARGPGWEDEVEIWSIGVPERLGGTDPGPATLQALLEEVGRSDPWSPWPRHLAACLTLRDAPAGRVEPDLRAAAQGRPISLGPGDARREWGAALMEDADGALWLQSSATNAETPLELAAWRLAQHRRWTDLPLAVGLAQDLVARSVAHVKLRRQFGKPLAGFQAVQHALAEMWAAAEELGALTLTARHAGPDDPLPLWLAWHGAVPRARAVAQAAVQLHGGTGLAEEAGIAPRFRALWSLTLAHAPDAAARDALKTTLFAPAATPAHARRTRPDDP